MRKYYKGSLYFILSGLMLIICSCTPQSCLEETEAFLKVSFYNENKSKLMAPDSITLYGLNMETNKIYKKALNVQPALIPLNSATESCVLIIKINNSINDTLKFVYSSSPHLVSKECGYTFYHYLESDTIRATHPIKISNRNITTVNEENIRIFY